ncbi:hypothetical protein ANN_03650 [Periplaneta americana]|uniref:SPT2 homolog N-terminal domain-containing protein n=1 Tax=Periplaneta americana TaxID=6978 RepID=A0ABQ8U3A3_PERAM|nr:hypothetical protein ANN_03650 [Periplaneta americana]
MNIHFQQVKCYKSSFDPPKKEQKTKSLSANIQKFLARKEEEEKQKVIEAKKKRDELLALRSQDGKAKKRVAAMLNRTKAANKAAIADAVDNENTAVTLGGLAQPDEDDYGYVSQEASAFYSKLMEKYSSIPSEETKSSRKPLLKSSVADLNDTKARVRMALLKEEEEEMMPHKRKRKTKEEKEKLKQSEGADKGESQPDYEETREYEEEKPEKPAKPRRPPPPPPMDFHQLLKIAEKKQFEPIKYEPKPKDEDEDERPMTKKQRAEFLKEKEWRMRKEGKLPPLSASKQDQKNRPPQSANERNRDQKNSRPPADSGQKNNRLPTDGNRDQKINRPFGDGPREQNINRYSDGNRDQKINRSSGDVPREQNINRYSDGNRDQKINRPSGDVPREQNINRYSDGNRDQKLNRLDGNRDQRNRLSENNQDQRSSRPSDDGSSSIPRIPKVNNSYKSEKEVKSHQRIPKLNGSSSSGGNSGNYSSSSGSNKNVKLQGNSDSKIGKERSRDDIRNSSVPGKPSVKTNHTPLSSASGHSSGNRNSVEQKKSSSSSNNNDSRNNNLSSYSKKLQESLLAKLQEKERSSGSQSSETSKFRVPEVPSAKVPRNRDSGSNDMNRGLKLPSKPSNKMDVREMMRKEAAMRKNLVKPLAASQNTNESARGALPSKSQESFQKNKLGHEASSKEIRDRKPTQLPSKDIKSRQFPPSDVKPRQFPPADVKPKQFPPADVRPRQFPPGDVRRKPQKPPAKRRIEDSDEEYDSEMDDFIDDGPLEDEDYSKHIKEIFGYDKSR